MLGIREGLLLVFLAWEAYEDSRSMTIRMDAVLIFGLIGIMVNIIERDLTAGAILLGSGLGGVLLIVSRLSKGQLGEGDGWVFLVSGLYLGGMGNMQLCYLAFLLVLVCGLMHLVTGLFLRRRALKELPFVPYVFAAFLVMNLWRMGG